MCAPWSLGEAHRCSWCMLLHFFRNAQKRDGGGLSGATAANREKEEWAQHGKEREREAEGLIHFHGSRWGSCQRDASLGAQGDVLLGEEGG